MNILRMYLKVLDLVLNYEAWPEKITNDENCNL